MRPRGRIPAPGRYAPDARRWGLDVVRLEERATGQKYPHRSFVAGTIAATVGREVLVGELRIRAPGEWSLTEGPRKLADGIWVCAPRSVVFKISAGDFPLAYRRTGRGEITAAMRGKDLIFPLVGDVTPPVRFVRVAGPLRRP